MLALLGDINLAEGLTGKVEIVVYLLLAQLADTYLIVETGDGSHFL